MVLMRLSHISHFPLLLNWSSSQARSSHETPSSSQLLHEVEASTGAYVPASQLVHVISEVAPVVLLAFPASQLVHEAEALVEYVPASQLVHVFSEVASVVLLAFPASHLTHEIEPSIIEYVPGSHTWQTFPDAVIVPY